jgi:glycosyl transferase family 2
VKLFVAIAAHATLLPHFLRHYQRSGVSHFFVSVEPALDDQVTKFASGFPVTIVRDLDTSESIEGGTAAVSEMRRRFAGPNEWIALTDLDEFQVHPDGIETTAAAADAEGANVVRGWMVDRVATDGLLKPVKFDDDVWRVFPEKCFVTAGLQGGLSYKCALVKGHLESSRNEDGLSLAHHHMKDERVASISVAIHHFKWNAEVLERIALAIERTRAAGQPFWVEYERVLEHLRTHGRLRWEDFADDPRSR